MIEVHFPRATYTWMSDWEVEIHLRCHVCFRFVIKCVKMEQIYVHKYVGCIDCNNGIDVMIIPEVTF